MTLPVIFACFQLTPLSDVNRVQCASRGERLRVTNIWGIVTRKIPREKAQGTQLTLLRESRPKIRLLAMLIAYSAPPEEKAPCDEYLGNCHTENPA